MIFFKKIGILKGNPSNALDIKRQVEQFGKAKQNSQKYVPFSRRKKNVRKDPQTLHLLTQEMNWKLVYKRHLLWQSHFAFRATGFVILNTF